MASTHRTCGGIGISLFSLLPRLTPIWCAPSYAQHVQMTPRMNGADGARGSDLGAVLPSQRKLTLTIRHSDANLRIPCPTLIVISISYTKLQNVAKSGFCAAFQWNRRFAALASRLMRDNRHADVEANRPCTSVGERLGTRSVVAMNFCGLRQMRDESEKRTHQTGPRG